MKFARLARKRVSAFSLQPSAFAGAAFSLVELMVVIGLLSLIVLALMAVFNTAQTAFRASVTQTDVLEGGRATMDRMAADLRQLAPSLSDTNLVNPAANFYAVVDPRQYGSQSAPLMQSLAGSGAQRMNVLENFFVLSRGNVNGTPTWFGAGYVVDTTSQGSLNPLYRFYLTTNATANPWWLYYSFTNAVGQTNFTNMSHLLDGVVTLTVRAYDTNGIWMTNGYSLGLTNSAKNVVFQPSTFGEVGFCMYSNTLPGSVEIELGMLEDRALQRADTWPNGTLAQSNYLAQQSGKVHVFRQRVTIANVDPSAYQ